MDEGDRHGLGRAGGRGRAGLSLPPRRRRGNPRSASTRPTGKEKWNSTYAHEVPGRLQLRRRPARDAHDRGGTVFTLGANGDLSAFNALDGKRLWHRNLRADYKADKGFFGFACSPLVIGKKVLVNVGGKGAGVVAFDAATGKELWKSTDDGASYSSPVAAEIDGKPAAVFLTRFGLRVLDPATGRSLYELPFRPRLERERAGRDAARVEGRNLPDGLVLDRRGAP